MIKKYKSIIYFIIFMIMIFCTIIINLFIHYKNMNKLYEDKSWSIGNSIFNYPYFNDNRDLFIEEYLNKVDINRVDTVKYMVNYLDKYQNVLFKLYKDDLIVDYHNIIFNNNEQVVNISSLITDENILNEKIELYKDLNKIKLTSEHISKASKSYLFKDKEMEIYLTNYNDEKSISLITINYQEIKEYLNIPYKLDSKYKKMQKESTKTTESKNNPIIPPPETTKPKKKIAFSFDDGPSSYTLELLDVLDEFKAKATFFLVGYNIKIRNSVVLEMFNRGFELGNHTIDHSRLTKFDCEKAATKIKENNELVLNITNSNMKLFRPPYGAINDKIKPCIEYPIILWSVDSRDWESRNTEKIVEEVMTNVKEGDIILFHDLYPTTIEAIKILLPMLYLEDYEVVSVSELFADKKLTLENGEVYRKVHS